MRIGLAGAALEETWVQQKAKRLSSGSALAGRVRKEASLFLMSEDSGQYPSVEESSCATLPVHWTLQSVEYRTHYAVSIWELELARLMILLAPQYRQ